MMEIKTIISKKGKVEIKYLKLVGTKSQKITSLKLNKAKQSGKWRVDLKDWSIQVIRVSDVRKSQIEKIEA